MTIEGINIEVQYKPIRTIRMVVRPDTSVHISAPVYASEEEVRAFVLKRTDWLHKAIGKMEARRALQANKPTLSPLQQLIEEQKQYRRLMAYLKPQFEYWRTKMELPPTQFTIRKMRSRWGSCTPVRRSIRFNLALANQSERAIDYIIVHELAHLRYANHGPQFKALVSRYMPDWKEREKELNANL